MLWHANSCLFYHQLSDIACVEKTHFVTLFKMKCSLEFECAQLCSNSTPFWTLWRPFFCIPIRKFNLREILLGFLAMHAYSVCELVNWYKIQRERARKKRAVSQLVRKCELGAEWKWFYDLLICMIHKQKHRTFWKHIDAIDLKTPHDTKTT